MSHSQRSSIEIDEMPTLVGQPAVVTFCASRLHVRVSGSAVRRALANGNLQSHFIGGRRLFAPADVVEWIKGTRGARTARGGDRQAVQS